MRSFDKLDYTDAGLTLSAARRAGVPQEDGDSGALRLLDAVRRFFSPPFIGLIAVNVVFCGVVGLAVFA